MPDKSTKDDFLPFFKPEIGQAETDEVLDTLRSGWLTTGEKVKLFEERCREHLGVPHALAVNSATAGLHLALEALGVGPGDEVITTPYTFTATAEVVRYLGAEVVFADIDERTCNIDPARVAEAVTGRTKAVIVVHFGGQCCDMDPIMDLRQRHGLGLVEDAAHALPADYKGRRAGTFGDVGVFSFYANKTITTGEGGMAVTSSTELADRMSVMRLHGIDRDVWNRYGSKRPAWYYEVVAPGFKYNMSDIMGALGIHQLARAEQMRADRQRVTELYDHHLAELPLILPHTARPGDTHARHLYTIQIPEEEPSRDEVAQGLSDAGIGISVHYLPLHMHPYWRELYSLQPDDFPVSHRVYERTLSLPLFPAMTEDDVVRVARALRGLLG